MPSWFSKVFKGDEPPGGESPAAAPPAPEAPINPNPILDDEDYRADMMRKARRIIDAPVLVEKDESPGPNGRIRIKAQPQRDGRTCVFLVDRPVFEGHSVWSPDRAAAAAWSPLAEALFDLDEVETVLVHHMTVTVTRTRYSGDWTPLAQAIGAKIREHLEAGRPVVSEAFLDDLPDEDAVRARIQQVIDMEINPGIAAHSGSIALERVEGNTVYISMGGGCQGCAASTITLRQGVHAAFRDAVPQLGAILDVTDHDAGTNPYFTELPMGMRADA